MEVRPSRLIEQYPRIVNLIAMDWSNPAAFRTSMADLVVDRRGGRIGFSETILRELQALRDHYYLSLADRSEPH